MIRFLEDIKSHREEGECHKRSSTPCSKTPLKVNSAPTKYAASISVTDILRAGKLVKKETPTVVELEKFDMSSMQWVTEKTRKFHVEKDQFSSGTFRKAFKATDTVDESKWVIKKYILKAVKNMKNLSMALDHGRKQVQLHTAARNVTQRCAKTAPPEFGETFQYGKVYFGFLNDVPVTLEELIDGQFAKYINNDGKCKTLSPGDKKCIYQKAQSLVHYSYELSKRKFMLLDIQGSMHNLNDPEIATSELFDGGEIYFCSGNLSGHVISNFVKEHVCSGYCVMLALETLLS